MKKELKFDVWYNQLFEEVEEVPPIKQKEQEGPYDFVEIPFGIQIMEPATPLLLISNGLIPAQEILYKKVKRKIKSIEDKLFGLGYNAVVLDQRMYFKFFLLDGCMGCRLYASLSTNRINLINFNGDIETFIREEIKWRDG